MIPWSSNRMFPGELLQKFMINNCFQLFSLLKWYNSDLNMTTWLHQEIGKVWFQRLCLLDKNRLEQFLNIVQYEELRKIAEIRNMYFLLKHGVMHKVISILQWELTIKPCDIIGYTSLKNLSWQSMYEKGEGFPEDMFCDECEYYFVQSFIHPNAHIIALTSWETFLWFVKWIGDTVLIIDQPTCKILQAESYIMFAGQHNLDYYEWLIGLSIPQSLINTMKSEFGLSRTSILIKDIQDERIWWHKKLPVLFWRKLRGIMHDYRACKWEFDRQWN